MNREKFQEYVKDTIKVEKSVELGTKSVDDKISNYFKSLWDYLKNSLSEETLELLQIKGRF